MALLGAAAVLLAGGLYGDECFKVALGDLETGGCDWGPFITEVDVGSGDPLDVPLSAIQWNPDHGETLLFHATRLSSSQSLPTVATWRAATPDGLVFKSWSLGLSEFGLASWAIHFYEIPVDEFWLEFVGTSDELLGRVNVRLPSLSCQDCLSSRCRATAELGSVDYRIPLGTIPGQGSLEVRPVMLRYHQDVVINQGLTSLSVLTAGGDSYVVINNNGAGYLDSVEVGDYEAQVVHLGGTNDIRRFRIDVSFNSTVFRSVEFESSKDAMMEDQLVITETLEGNTETTVFRKPSAEEWVVETGSGLRRETRTTTEPNATTKVERVIIEELIHGTTNHQVVSDHETTKTLFDWGWEVTEEVVAPDGAALTTTSDYYEPAEDSSPGGTTSYLGEGRLKAREYPTGETETHYYYECAVPQNFDTAQAHMVTSAFAETQDDLEVITCEASTTDLKNIRTDVETKADGTTISKSETHRTRVEIEEQGVVVLSGALVEDRVYDSASTYFTSYRFENDDRSVLTVNPDLTATRTSRSTDGNGVTTVTRKSGYVTTVPTASEPEPAVEVVSESVTKTNKAGEVIEYTEKRYSPDETFETVAHRLATDIDDAGRVLEYTHLSDTTPPNNLLTTELEYNCCGLARTSDLFGIETFYTRDALGRVVKTNSFGVTIENVYTGRTAKVYRYAEEPDEGVLSTTSLATDSDEISRTVNDVTGEAVELWRRTGDDGSLVKTTIATQYDLGSGIGRRVTTTLPSTADDGAVTPEHVADYYLDGTPASQTGTLGPASITEYDADATGLVTERSLLDGAAKRETVTTSFDWARRPVRTTFASDEDGVGGNDYAEFFYNGANQLVREVDPDGVTNLYEYNDRGERTTVAIDLNDNDAINPGVDQIQFVERELPDGVIQMRTTSIVDGTGGQGSVVTGYLDESFDGLERTVTSYPNDLPNTVHSITLYVSPGSWTTTTTLPDSTYQVESYSGALLDNIASYDANDTLLFQVSYSYDSLNRLKTITDSRQPGVLTYNYVSDAVDLVASVVDPGGRTTSYTYDQRDRVIEVDRPDSLDAAGNGLENKTTTAYYPSGLVKEVDGGLAYRRTYAYDYAQRLATLTTYGTQTAVTRWNYDTARGFLRSERYNSPTPGTGSGPDYTSYSAAGRLLEKVQVRLHTGNRLKTTYGFGTAANSHPGLLDSVAHADSTPGFEVDSRDRLGRPLVIDDEVAGTRTANYLVYGNPDVEAISGTGLLSGTSLDYDYDSQGRLQSVTADTGTPTWATGYAYDSAGRLFSVTADDHRAEYHYHPVHHRIAQVSFRPAGTGSSSPVLQNTRQYDDLRRLAGTTWHSASTGGAPVPLVHFGYDYNDLDQRTKQSHLDGTAWKYGYNSAGELTLADKVDAAGTTYYPGRQFRYGYDGIGNRTSQESGGDTSGANRRSDALTPTVLNQYSSIAHSGELDITGQAPSATPITVNAATATRVGEYFHGEVSGDNSSGPLWEGVTVSDGSNPVSGDLFVPAAATAPTYDLDGNCLSDGAWDYVWDAANRLVSATRSSAAQTAGAPYRRYEYAYDYLDRRIRAERFDSAQGNPVATTHYLYDGWNCIAELDESLDPVRTYTWGLDLSGTLQGGGGVAGLLWIEDNASGDLHFAAYDGIGNLTNLIAEDGTALTASYEYDPFGNLLRATGPYAAENPVRFSTKFHNPETGLSYYGYRYYNPAQGRWLNRDPIAEDGGLNLYGFVANDPAGSYDFLGNDDRKWYERVRDGMVRISDPFVAELGHTASDMAAYSDDFLAETSALITEGEESLYALEWARQKSEDNVSLVVSNYLVEREVYGADYANYNMMVGSYLGGTEGLIQGTIGAGHLVSWITGEEAISEFLEHNMNNIRWAKNQIGVSLCADLDSTSFKVGDFGGQVVGTLTVPGGELLVIRTAGATGKGLLLARRAKSLGTGGDDVIKIFHGTSSNRASKIVGNEFYPTRGFRPGADGAVFFGDEFSTARHFAEEAAASTGARSSTVIEFSVPRWLADDLGLSVPRPLGGFRGAVPLDIPGASGTERILTGSSIDSFNDALRSGAIGQRRARVR